MRSTFFVFLLGLLSVFADNVKRVVIVVWPGGKSHHFILKELLSYSLSKDNTYEFHILSHVFDEHIWKGSPYHVYYYGNTEEYIATFEKALHKVKEDPIWGYSDFQAAMIDNYQYFIDAGILGKLKSFGKFDLVITDFPTYLTQVLIQQLNIPKSIYFTPTCSPTLFYDDLELNTAYVPLIGSDFTDDMGFFTRLQNMVYHYGSRVFFKYYMYLHVQFWAKHGINVSLDIFVHNSVFLSQCTNGVHYPIPLPPNADNIGPILPKPAKPVGGVLGEFLTKFKRNIYFSQGTIVKIIEFEKILEIFNSFKDVGFVLSFKKEFIENHKFPENVIALEWVPQNDLLGHPAIVGFITHGGINSLLESIYHAKPVVCIGTGIDQINNAVIVEYRKIGIKITKESDVNAPNLIKALHQILENEELTINVRKLSKIVKAQNPKEKFFYWLNMTMAVGYDNLIVPAYLNKNYIQLNNLDVFAFMLLLVYIAYRVLRWLLSLCFSRRTLVVKELESSKKNK